jgi:hypothetical protein
LSEPTVKSEPKGKSGNMASKAIRWHHSLAQVTGGLSLRITRQQFSRKELRQWVDTINAVAVEMEEVANDTM